MNRAYLDWAAGAPVHPAAREAALEALALGAGNPSSVHGEGRAARALLERARADVAALCGCSPREVVFTASGSEANATAVLGASRAAGRGARLLVGATEHPSVRLAAAQAAAEGAEVLELPVDAEGRLLPARGAAAGAPATLLAAQWVNNETGVIQPMAELAAAAREAGAHVHCDAVQAAGKLDLSEVVSRCDTVAISAHKLGGLPGAAALVVRRGVELPPLVPGHQERGLRGGTPALPALAAFGAVARLAAERREAHLRALAARTAELEAIVRRIDPAAIVRGAGAARAPGIVSATFPGADGETLLVSLDLAGVAASLGAACSTGALEPSHVLVAMGLSTEEARSTLRLSVGPATTEAELERLAAALPDALAAARGDARPRGCR